MSWLHWAAAAALLVLSCRQRGAYGCNSFIALRRALMTGPKVSDL